MVLIGLPQSFFQLGNVGLWLLGIQTGSAVYHLHAVVAVLAALVWFLVFGCFSDLLHSLSFKSHVHIQHAHLI